MGSKKFEYRVIVPEYDILEDYETKARKTEAQINKLADQGFRLMFIRGSIHHYFEREISEDFNGSTIKDDQCQPLSKNVTPEK